MLSAKGVMAAAGIFALLACSACSKPGASDSNQEGDLARPYESNSTTVTRPVESEALREAMSDGKVTYEEYLAGYRQYADCLDAEGYSLAMTSESNLVMQYSVPSEAVSSGADERCYTLEFGPLDANWQIQREDTSESALAIRNCLIAHDVEPLDTLAKMDQQLRDAGISLEECLR